MERLTYMDGGKWRMVIGDTEYSGKEREKEKKKNSFLNLQRPR